MIHQRINVFRLFGRNLTYMKIPKSKQTQLNHIYLLYVAKQDCKECSIGISNIIYNMSNIINIHLNIFIFYILMLKSFGWNRWFSERKNTTFSCNELLLHLCHSVWHAPIFGFRWIFQTFRKMALHIVQGRHSGNHHLGKGKRFGK